MTTDQSVLRKVKGLLDKAHSTTNEHEKEAFFAKADELMRRYTIEEFMLEQLDESKGRTPVIRDYDIPRVDGDFEFNDNLARLFVTLCNHTGIKIVYRARPTKIVGWQQDLDFLDILFTSLYTDLMANMKPRWDPDLPEGENLHNFKQAGFKWEDIWYEKCKVTGESEPWQRKHGVRWTNVYKKWADRTGTDRQMSSGLRYFRIDFGYGYVQEVADRLRRIREAREQDAEHVAIVLKDRKSELEDFIEEHWPTPPPAEVTPGTGGRVPKIKTRSLNTSAYRAGRKQGAKADLGQGRIGG